jgi:hypothetical protein
LFDVDQSPWSQAGAASLTLFVVHGVTMPDWFVTFEIRKRGLLHKRERSPRQSRMFATEAEAKMFARAKLDEGLIVFAGTVSPYSPKQLILPNDIARWLTEQ